MASSLANAALAASTLTSSFQGSRDGLTASPSPRCEAVAWSAGVRCQQAGPARRIAPAAVHRRSLLGLAGIALPALVAADALALLEGDEDEALLEKVRGAKKQREAKLAAAADMKSETSVLQQTVNRLAKTGKFLDEDKYEEAKELLGSSGNSDWITSVEGVFSKISGNDGRETAAASFSSAIEALQISVAKKDGASSKSQFVAGAQALEKWIDLAGLGSAISGL